MPRQQAASGSTLHGFVVGKSCDTDTVRHVPTNAGSVRVLRFDGDRGVASKRQAALEALGRNGSGIGTAVFAGMIAVTFSGLFRPSLPLGRAQENIR
jgi:hypothetical protein